MASEHPSNVDIVDNEVQHTANISPALKRKAAAEATKNERYGLPLLWPHELTRNVHRIKRAKDLDEARMKPTLKKPSGRRDDNNPPASLHGGWESKRDINTAAEDDNETDAGSEDESEDIKPPGSLTRSSSVSCLDTVKRLLILSC